MDVMRSSLKYLLSDIRMYISYTFIYIYAVNKATFGTRGAVATAPTAAVVRIHNIVS